MMMMVAPAQVQLNVFLTTNVYIFSLPSRRQSSIPSLAQVHGRDRAAVEADSLQR